MPLTFIDIERRKSGRIAAFFLVLMLLYFCVNVLVAAALFQVPPAQPGAWILAAMTALVIAGIHFWFSSNNMTDTVVRSLNAQQPDPQDDIHRMLLNIMEEVQVATGHRRKISCLVVPSLSMNALAVADLKGDALIAITEGLLSRLTRPQLETVVAHEAHHILSGDCTESTLAAGLFGSYAAALEKFSYSPRGSIFSLPAFLLAWVLLRLGYLLNLFISRDREYRADAAAVRMTRNPVALAETLHLFSRSWRGAGFIGSGLQSLCIVNPAATALDEREGFWADLLSTHPPLSTRIQVLLKMARVSVAELEAKARKRAGQQEEQPALPAYYAMNPQQQWQGPFTLAELEALSWLSPLTWITAGENQAVDRAWKHPELGRIFAARLSGSEKRLSGHSCPACSQPLVIHPYEGTRTYQCDFCEGTLVENDKITRIIARAGRERTCSRRIVALTRAVLKQNYDSIAKQVPNGQRSQVPRLACPGCRNEMHRAFYSSAHLIEVDRCSFCGFTWFERDELAMLQCLIENRITSEAPMLSEGSPGAVPVG